MDSVADRKTWTPLGWVRLAVIGVPVLVLLLVSGFLVLWGVDAHVNRGFSSGYWGVYNRVHGALRAMPGTEVEEVFYNGDVTLEEFGFRVRRPGDPQLFELYFGERDELRSLKGRELTEGLSRRMEEVAPATGK